MTEAVRDLVLRAKREKPRRAIRRIVRMLERASAVRPRRAVAFVRAPFLAREGISARPARGDDDEGCPLGTPVERRSFIAEHVGDLWVGDALHVHRRVRFPCGRVGRAYLLSQIDSASRYVAHSYFAEREESSDQEHGFRQGIRNYGVPRTYDVDRGPAYIARSPRGDLRGPVVPPAARGKARRGGQGCDRALAPDCTSPCSTPSGYSNGLPTFGRASLATSCLDKAVVTLAADVDGPFHG